MILLKDFTSLKYLHEWMHRPANYWIHAHHHKVHHELNSIHTFRIDRIDIILENGIGTILLMIIQYLIYGKVEISMAAIFFVGYHDIVIHYVNPYTNVHLNPILAYFCKPNMEHNLHHITQEDYYMFNSFSHFNRKTRDKDVAKYNKLLGTNIFFDLFV